MSTVDRASSWSVWGGCLRPVLETKPAPIPAAVVAAVIAGWTVMPVALRADDWPTFRGNPQRTAVGDGKGIAEKWPEEGPRKLWTFDDAGAGYSGPVVAGGRVYLSGERGNDVSAFCLDLATGKPIWIAKIDDKPGEGEDYGASWGRGPRGSPTVHDGRVYVLGQVGRLACLDLDGKALWSTHLVNDHGGKVPSFGYTESPLVIGDLCVVKAGGDKGTVLAFDRKTGKVVWRSGGITDQGGSSSLVAAEFAGRKQIIALTEKALVALSPDDGSIIWSVPTGKDGGPSRSTPLVVGDRVILTEARGDHGPTSFRIGGPKGDVVESLTDAMAFPGDHGGAVAAGGRLVGHAGEKIGWVCLDLAGQHYVWTDKTIAAGSTTAAGKLVCTVGHSHGMISLFEAGEKGPVMKAQFAFPALSKTRGKDNGVYTHPVIAGGILLVRDQEMVHAVDLRPAKPVAPPAPQP